MANLLEQDKTLFTSDLTHEAQVRVASSGRYHRNWIWSHASHESGGMTARLVFATFRQADILQGEITKELLGTVLERSEPRSDADRGFISLLVDQAQSMVEAKGEYNPTRVNSKASTAVASEAGHLALGVVEESVGYRVDTSGLALLDSFGLMLENAGVTMAPVVREEIAIDRARALEGPNN